MNAIDAGRNELARLGLHPGARHHVADSTPVQDEDTTIFYDYWTYGKPTVINTSKTGRPLEVTIYMSATDGEEQAIPIVGETACHEYLRQAVVWKSGDADRTRQDAAHAHIMARITELAEDNPALTAWALAQAPVVDINTEDLTLSLTDLGGDPMIDLHTSGIAGGGWARLPGHHALDELDKLIASPGFSRLPHMMGIRRESLTAFLTVLSDDLDEIHYDAMHAPGVPTLAQAIKAANRAQPTIEAGRQELARLGFTVPKRDVRRLPEVLDDGVLFNDYDCFDLPSEIVTDNNGCVVEVRVGYPPSRVNNGKWEVELIEEASCREFLRYAARWDASRNERYHIMYQGVSDFIRDQAQCDSLNGWERTINPSIDECTVDTFYVTLNDKKGQKLITIGESSYGGEVISYEGSECRFFDSLNEFMDSNELIYSLDLIDASYRAEIVPERFASFIIDFFEELDVIYSRAIQGDKWNSMGIISEAAQLAQSSATSATRRSSIPPEMLGKSAPYLGTQAFKTTPMRWVPTPTIHQTEGRSL